MSRSRETPGIRTTSNVGLDFASEFLPEGTTGFREGQVNVACELALEANAIGDSYVLNALNRFKPQPPVEVIAAPQRLQLKEEPRADVARYDVLLKKLALAAIAVLPTLLAAASNRGVEVPYGTP